MNMVNTPKGLRGTLTTYAGNMVQGWVHSHTEPERQWAVALYDGSQLLALAHANAFHPQAPGSGLHGFSIALGDAQWHQATALTLCLANAPEHVLDQVTLTPASTTLHTPESSRVQWQPGLMLSGWMVEPSAPQQPLTLLVRERGKLLAEATPKHWLTYDQQQVKGAFNLTLPFSLADGEPHTLTVTDHLGRELSGSPLTVQEWPNGLNDWIRTLAPQLPAATKALLARQLDRYERWLPRAAGLASYPEWLHATETPNTARTSKGCIGIVWLGAAPKQPAKVSGLTLQHRSADTATQENPSAYQALLQQLAQQTDAVLQLHEGDTFSPQALQQAWQALATTPAAQLVYSDFDIPPAEEGQPALPALLPAWDPERQWAQDIVGGGLCLVRSQALLNSEHYTAAQHPEEFSYAALEAINAFSDETSVLHLPLIGRHRRQPWPTTSQAQLERLQPRLARQDAHATLSLHATLPVYHYRRQLTQAPSITLVVPTRDALSLLKRCVDTIAEHTDYPGEVTLLVVNNGSTQPETLEYFATLRRQPAQPLGQGQLHTEVLDYPHPFNYAAINNAAVEHASTELIALVNNDIEALHPAWLCEMTALLQRTGTGAVGAKLLWPNGMVQHGGVIGGQYGGLAGHVGNHWHEDDHGYLYMNHLTQRFSMVTAACLLLRKADYLAVGGLNPRDYPVGFNDVDLCLKLRRRGLSVVWTPNARLIHAESATRGKDEAPEKAARAQREMTMLRERWGNALYNDPAYNPNLALDVYTAPFTGLALPPRNRTARTNALKL
tara:strand:+ start:22329 stop:24677 length:2349 start_codon:yes stop_codon:yes gene_type:complete